MTGVLTRRRNLERDRHTQREDNVLTQGEDSHVITEAAIEVMHLQVKEHEGYLANTRSYNRQGRIDPCSLQREHDPADTLILDFLASRTMRE